MAYNFNIRSRFIKPTNPFVKSRFDLPDNAFQVKRPKFVNPFNRDYNQESETSSSDIPYQPTGEIPYDPESLDYIKKQVADVQKQSQQNQPAGDLYGMESFADAYGRMNKERPRRLAYQEAVDKGPEEIKRSKWMKVLAGVGGGAAAFGGEPGGQAGERFAKLYQAPQERANQRYREKIAELGKLANMEDSDFQDRLKALELDRSDMWKGEDFKLKDREDRRQQIESVLRQNADVRDAKLDDANLKRMAYDLEHAGDKVITDPVDGTMKIVRENGTERVIGKTQLSQLEKTVYGAQEAGAKRTAENIADEPYEVTKAARAKDAALALEGARGDNRIELEDARRETAVARIREHAANTPDIVARNMQLDLADEIAKKNLPVGAESYLHFDENGTPSISGGTTGSSATEVAMRDWLARSLAKNRSGGAPGEPSSQSNSGTTSTGVDYSLREVGGAKQPGNMTGAASDLIGSIPDGPAVSVPNMAINPNYRVPPKEPIMSPAPVAGPNMSPNVREPIMSPAGTQQQKQPDDRSLVELEIALDALKRAKAQGASPAELARVMKLVADARAKVQ